MALLAQLVSCGIGLGQIFEKGCPLLFGVEFVNEGWVRETVAVVENIVSRPFSMSIVIPRVARARL